MEGHRWFPRQPRQRPDDCERGPGEHTHKVHIIFLSLSLTHTHIHTHTHTHWINICKFMQKTAEITKDSMLWFSNAAHYFFFLPQSTNSLTLLNVARSSSRSSLPPSLQICVGKNEEIDSFLRLSSGKKRGLVPVTCVLEI